MQIIQALLPPLIGLIDALMPILQTLMDLLDPIIELFISLLDPIVNLISGALTPLVQALEPIISVIKTALMPILRSLGERFSETFGAIAELVGNQISTVKNVLSGIIEFLRNVFTGNWRGAWESVKKIFGSIWEGIKNAFKVPINWIIDGINKFLKGLNKIEIPDWVPLVGGKGFDIKLIPRLKKGLDFVPGDYFPAYLDYGERVLTRQENQIYTAMGGLRGIEQILSGGAGKSTQNTMTIEVPVVLNGREIARVTAKPTGERMMWEEL